MTQTVERAAQRSPARPDGLAPRLAAGVVLACGGALALGAIAFGWVLVWALMLSLLVFLGGPNAPVGLRDVPTVVLTAPPVLATLASYLAGVRWLRRGRSPVLEPEPVLLRERLGPPLPWLGRVPVALLVLLGLVGFAGYARTVFLYHRIQGAIDEGLYLYAGRLALAGHMPYRDFYFDQAPLLPYVFGLALGPFHYDERAARLFAIACTLLTLLVTFAAAARLGGRLAGLLAFALLLTNFDFLTELSAGVESNGSFTALVVALVGLALAYERLGLALILAVVAAGLRQLFIPLPIVVACYVALARHKPWRALLAGLLPLVVLYGGFALLGGEAALLGMVRPIRSPYVVRVTADLTPLATVASFRDMLLAVLPAYLPFFLCAGPAAYLALRRRPRHAALLLSLALASLFVLLANILPYPNNPYYPITQLPLAAVLGAVSLISLVEGAPSQTARRGLLATMGLILVVAPLLAYRSPEYIDQFQGRPPLARFLAASDYLRQVAPPDAVLVTLETPFATQTGMRLPHGLEAGSWGVYRGVTPEKARALGVVTYPMLVDMVEQGVGDVVIESDRYGFLKNYMSNDAERDRLAKALADKYELRETFGNISDWGDVRLYTKKAAGG